MRIARDRGAHIQRLSALFKRLSTLTEVGPGSQAALLPRKHQVLHVKTQIETFLSRPVDVQKSSY